MGEDVILRLQARQQSPMRDDIAGEATRSCNILFDGIAGFLASLPIERADADRPEIGHEDGASRDLGAGMGDGDGAPAHGLRIFDPRQDEARLGEQRAAEFGDEAEFAREKPGNEARQGFRIFGETGRDRLAREIDRQAAANIENGDLPPPDRGIDRARESERLGDAGGD